MTKKEKILKEFERIFTKNYGTEIFIYPTEETVILFQDVEKTEMLQNALDAKKCT